MLAVFLKGLIIGFAIAAPVGPIGVLCIQRSLYAGWKSGLMTGLGAAFADGTYGLIAALGLTAIASLLIEQQFWIRIVGGIFLIYLGLKTLSATVGRQTAVENLDKSALHSCVSTYFLTLANPMTILSFIGIFAGLGLADTSADTVDVVSLVIGVVVGSSLWWLFLSGFVAYILHRIVNQSAMRIINWFSGIIIILFGLAALRAII